MTMATPLIKSDLCGSLMNRVPLYIDFNLIEATFVSEMINFQLYQCACFLIMKDFLSSILQIPLFCSHPRAFDPLICHHPRIC